MEGTIACLLLCFHLISLLPGTVSELRSLTLEEYTGPFSWMKRLLPEEKTAYALHCSTREPEYSGVVATLRSSEGSDCGAVFVSPWHLITSLACLNESIRKDRTRYSLKIAGLCTPATNPKDPDYANRGAACAKRRMRSWRFESIIVDEHALPIITLSDLPSLEDQDVNQDWKDWFDHACFPPADHLALPYNSSISTPAFGRGYANMRSSWRQIYRTHTEPLTGHPNCTKLGVSSTYFCGYTPSLGYTPSTTSSPYEVLVPDRGSPVFYRLPTVPRSRLFGLSDADLPYEHQGKMHRAIKNRALDREMLYSLCFHLDICAKGVNASDYTNSSSAMKRRKAIVYTNFDSSKFIDLDPKCPFRPLPDPMLVDQKLFCQRQSLEYLRHPPVPDTVENATFAWAAVIVDHKARKLLCDAIYVTQIHLLTSRSCVRTNIIGNDSTTPRDELRLINLTPGMSGMNEACHRSKVGCPMEDLESYEIEWIGWYESNDSMDDLAVVQLAKDFDVSSTHPRPVCLQGEHERRYHRTILSFSWDYGEMSNIRLKVQQLHPIMGLSMMDEAQSYCWDAGRHTPPSETLQACEYLLKRSISDDANSPLRLGAAAVKSASLSLAGVLIRGTMAKLNNDSSVYLQVVRLTDSLCVYLNLCYRSYAYKEVMVPFLNTFYYPTGVKKDEG